MDRLLFIDVSSYEFDKAHPIDYHKAQANGIHAVCFRLTQGTAKDPSFDDGWAACKGILPRQAYLLLDCRYDWKPQAQLLIDTLKNDPGELPPVIDFEYPFSMPDTQYWKYPFAGWNPLYNVLEMLKSAGYTGNKLPWIYTNWNMWNVAGPRTGSPQEAYFTQYPLWVASYNHSLPLQDGDQPALPHGWKDWILWQFTPSGQTGDAQKFGINPADATSVDESVFNGTETDFYALVGQFPAPVPSPAPQPTSSSINHIVIDVLSDTPVTLYGVEVDSVDYKSKAVLNVIPLTPPVGPAPEPPPTSVPDVQSDILYGIIRTQKIQNPLTLGGKFTPAVMRINDKSVDAWPAVAGQKGAACDVTPSRQAFVDSLNSDPKGADYVNNTVGAMLINSPGHVESLDCQHNFVSGTIIQNNCLKLNCFQSDEDFAPFMGVVNFDSRPDLIFKCLAENLGGTFSKVGAGIDAYAPLTATSKSQGGTGEMWVGLEYLEMFPTLPVDVTITSTSGLNIHSTFSFDPATKIGAYSDGEKVTIYAYRPIGASVFGQTDKGWICLVDRRTSPTGTFYTSWHLDTDGVLP